MHMYVCTCMYYIDNSKLTWKTYGYLVVVWKNQLSAHVFINCGNNMTVINKRLKISVQNLTNS